MSVRVESGLTCSEAVTVRKSYKVETLIGSRDAVAQAEPGVGAWDSSQPVSVPPPSPRVSFLCYCRALPYKCLQVIQVCDL